MLVNGTLHGGLADHPAEPLDVLRVLDLLTAVPAADVRGDLILAFRDSNSVEVGKHDERALCAVVRHRVIVEVEADIGSLANLDLESLERRKGGVRMRQEEPSLILERLTNSATPVFDPGAIAVTESCLRDRRFRSGR